MSEPKWTPGEWSAQMVGRPMGDHQIPTMWWLRYGAVSMSTDNPADASLCAAAPDLYAALAAICDEDCIDAQRLANGKAALRKARSEA